MLQPVDHLLAEGDLPLRQPLADLGNRLGETVEVVGDEKAFQRHRAGKDLPEVVGPGHRLLAVVTRDGAAEHDAGVLVEGHQRGVQYLAADVVEVDVHPVRAGLANGLLQVSAGAVVDRRI
ncbi:hypothetical protein D3C85_1599230 [compost metagenome]